MLLSNNLIKYKKKLLLASIEISYGLDLQNIHNYSLQRSPTLRGLYFGSKIFHSIFLFTLRFQQKADANTTQAGEADPNSLPIMTNLALD